MLFMNTVTGDYPRHIGDLEQLGWSQGEPLPEGFVQVEYASAIPERGVDEIIEETEPQLVDGVYKQTFIVRPMTAEEIVNRDAPQTAWQKLVDAGLSETEIRALIRIARP